MDRFVADSALAILPVFDSVQGRTEPLELSFSASADFHGHGLRLQRIHPGESADPGLVEFYGFRGLVSSFLDSLELVAQLQQLLSEVFEIDTAGSHFCVPKNK